MRLYTVNEGGSIGKGRIQHQLLSIPLVIGTARNLGPSGMSVAGNIGRPLLNTPTMFGGIRADDLDLNQANRGARGGCLPSSPALGHWVYAIGEHRKAEP